MRLRPLLEGPLLFAPRVRMTLRVFEQAIRDHILDSTLAGDELSAVVMIDMRVRDDQQVARAAQLRASQEELIEVVSPDRLVIISTGPFQQDPSSAS